MYRFTVCASKWQVEFFKRLEKQVQLPIYMHAYNVASSSTRTRIYTSESIFPRISRSMFAELKPGGIENGREMPLESHLPT